MWSLWKWLSLVLGILLEIDMHVWIIPIVPVKQHFSYYLSFCVSDTDAVELITHAFTGCFSGLILVIYEPSGHNKQMYIIFSADKPEYVCVPIVICRFQVKLKLVKTNFGNVDIK